MNNEKLNKFIYFLNEYPKLLPPQLIGELYFQKYGERIAVTMMLKEFERLNLLDASGENYGLSISKRNELKVLPKDYENRPYEYFLFELNKKEQDEFNSKWYNSENARLQYHDYPKTQKMAKAALLISIILLLLEIVKLITHKN